MSVIVPVLVFCALVFVHELGHFLLAKAAGVSVVEFAIGFGPKLFSFQGAETRYSLRAIPLGGYVKMVGEDPRDAALSDEEIVSRGREAGLSDRELSLMRERTRWFSAASLGWRSLIVAAGPAANVLFALLISIVGLAMFGAPESVNQPSIGATIPGQPAERAGLRPQDIVVSIDGRALATWEDLATTVRRSGGNEMLFVVRSKNEEGSSSEREVRVTAVAESSELDYLAGAPAAERPYRIGIFPETTRRAVSLEDSFSEGAMHTWAVTVMTVKGMIGMVSGAISSKNLAGPIFIFGEAGRSAKRGVDAVLDFMVVLNIGLAILNLLPIPVLDGGHLLFFAIEALTRRPVNLRVREMANQVGLFLLLGLMVYALGNDILRHLGAL